MIFKLHTVYNKHEMIKIGNQSREIASIIPSARIVLLPTVKLLKETTTVENNKKEFT